MQLYHVIIFLEKSSLAEVLFPLRTTVGGVGLCSRHIRGVDKNTDIGFPMTPVEYPVSLAA